MRLVMVFVITHLIGLLPMVADMSLLAKNTQHLLRSYLLGSRSYGTYGSYGTEFLTEHT